MDLVILYVLSHALMLCAIVILCVILKIQMAVPDDNLNDDIMTDIINAGTNADVDDTSQYFADYEDILNIPVVEDQQIVAQKKYW